MSIRSTRWVIMKRSAIVRPALAGLVACAIAVGVFVGLQAVGIGADDDDADAETLVKPGANSRGRWPS